MSKIILKVIVCIVIILNGVGMLFLGIEIKDNERLLTLLNILLVITMAILVIIYLINLVIYIKNNRRRKVDAIKIEENILEKKKLAEENYQGYYKTVKKHLFWGDLYYFLVILILYVIYSLYALMADPARGYFIFLLGFILFLAINFVIGRDVPPYDPDFELKESDFPKLWHLIRKVAAQYKIKKNLKCYFNMDFNASVNETDKECTIFLGVLLLQLLSEKELESILNHEFAHVFNKDTKRTYSLLRKLTKWMEIVNAKGGSKFLFAVLFSPLSNTLSTDFELFEFVSRRTVERIADLAIKDKADSQVFINALAKISLYNIFDSEEAYSILEVYHQDYVPNNYFNILFNKFLDYYNQNKDLWNELIVKRIPARIESHLTFKGRMELMEVSHFEVQFNNNIPELEQIINLTNDLIVKYIEPTYEERRKNDYLQPMMMISRYEEHPEELDRLELFMVAKAYRIFNKFDQALSIYNLILSEYSEHPQALFEKGTLLLSMFNQEGIDYIYQAISLNENYIDIGLNIISEYCLKMGLQDEMEKVRNYRREVSNYFFNVQVHKSVSPNDRFVATTLNKEVIQAVVKFIKADRRIVKVYLADKVINKEHRTTVIGYTINKEFRDELPDIHEKIFDYLDNDRREQFTLIALDEDPIFIKNFKAVKDSLKYSNN